ncbi:MAG: MaoC family dehydratase, partial [Candidatus Nanopelagicales bacterium]
MASRIKAADLNVGDELDAQEYPIRRVDLVRYAGASGDFNVIHWNERVATSVGLPNVIAHGMLTMAMAARIVTDWLGDPGALVEYGVRFTKPIVISDDDVGVRLQVTAQVTELLEGNRAKVQINATCDGAKVLGMA